ncbi:MAG TPA: hypothetical protein VEU62_18020 [Bryobacterales bacterium]|nr:hypothetical protein [Bryobacterales bacterium]
MDYRNFEVASQAAGERYQVEFRWLQTAISLRHSDTVDVKFLVNGEGKIVALPHAALEQATQQAGARLSDELCLRIAAEHLQEALATGADAEKEILTLTPARVAELAGRQLRRVVRQEQGSAA